MASNITQEVGILVKHYEVDLGVCVTKISFYTTALRYYNIIIGIDWLESHDAVLYCKEKRIVFIDYAIYKKILVGTKRGISLRFISTL